MSGNSNGYQSGQMQGGSPMYSGAGGYGGNQGFGGGFGGNQFGGGQSGYGGWGNQGYFGGGYGGQQRGGFGGFGGFGQNLGWMPDGASMMGWNNNFSNRGMQAGPSYEQSYGANGSMELPMAGGMQRGGAGGMRILPYSANTGVGDPTTTPPILNMPQPVSQYSGQMDYQNYNPVGGSF